MEVDKAKIQVAFTRHDSIGVFGQMYALLY